MPHYLCDLNGEFLKSRQKVILRLFFQKANYLHSDMKKTLSVLVLMVNGQKKGYFCFVLCNLNHFVACALPQ